MRCAAAFYVLAFLSRGSVSAEESRSGVSGCERLATDVYARVSPAVVAITCRQGPEMSFFGTGTIVDPSGVILTSLTVVPKGGEEILVYLRGGRILPGRLLLTEESCELSLVKVDPDPAGSAFSFARLGDSSAAAIGEPALSFGNAFQSIESDDQVSLGEGIVSGFYDVSETLSQSKYSGAAIETSAPLNSGADGGPLVDREGRILGLLSLNYSRSRWLGTAVPANRLKPFLRPHLTRVSEAEEPCPASLGMDFAAAADGSILVEFLVPDGPAARAGAALGDRIVAIEGAKIEDLVALREALKKLRPCLSCKVEVRRGEETVTLEIQPWGRL